MSRSYRRTPVSTPYGCQSEKADKRLWHRRMRAAILVRLHNADPDEVWLPHTREVSNPWCMGKDGKWRFDPQPISQIAAEVTEKLARLFAKRGGLIFY